MNRLAGKLWSEVFGRSKMGTAVWTDREMIGRLSGVQLQQHGAYLMGSSAWQEYADGGWLSYANYTWSGRERCRGSDLRMGNPAIPLRAAWAAPSTPEAPRRAVRPQHRPPSGSRLGST